MAVTDRIGVGMVGYAFMGRAHSMAWRNVRAVFDDPLRPEMRVVCGRHREAVTAAARRLGWAGIETDWRAMIDRDDVGLVDICTTGATHAEIAIAALDAGKHVLCEKPMANTVAEAEAMAAAARRAAERDGVVAMVGFNYRRIPAIVLAHEMIASGVLGAVRHVRARYLQDWLADPAAPATWRLAKEEAGSGALGDIGSHAIDLAQYLTGQSITQVSALTQTFVHERPTRQTSARAETETNGETRHTVTVDDAALFLARFDAGAIATFEATRMATGMKNSLQVMVDGEHGSIRFDLARLNELEVFDGRDGVHAGSRRIMVTEAAHPYMAGWWPPGHVLGWVDTFVHQSHDLLSAIVAATQPRPSFEDALVVQRVLAAVEDSVATGAWALVDDPALSGDGATPWISSSSGVVQSRATTE